MVHISSEIKTDITSGYLSIEEIFQKHIVDGNSFFFQHILKDLSREYQIKSLIADYFGVHIHDVKFVGSAKLGYSLKPTQLFQDFDHRFKLSKQKKDKSDIDIAIISPYLFERLGQNIYDFTNGFKDVWADNEYYTQSTFEIPINYKYYEYFVKGWFRPDMKPKGFDICVKESYEDLKGLLYREFKRKVGVGLYKDWYYFKKYQMNNIENLSFKVQKEIL